MRERAAAVAWSLAYLVLGYTGMFTLTVWATAWRRRQTGGPLGLIEAGAIQSVAGLLTFGVLTLLIGRVALRLPWHELGWRPRAESLRGFGRGFALASAIAILAVLTGLPFGSSWSLDGGTFAAWLGRLLLLALVLLPPAFMEELAFRGVAVAGMARGVGHSPAIVITAVLFGVAHVGNPEVTSLALGNIALAGVFLGLTFFARGGIMTATGAHLGWNLMQAGSAAPVSGLPFAIPWIDFNPGEPVWLTGGAFGPEGGVLATIALTVGAIVVLRSSDYEEAA